MRFIKYFFLVFLIGSLASCLKSKNDFAGLRTDPGTIVTAITEKQYLNTDAQNIGYGFQVFTNFSFTTPTTEDVRFFTLHVSQPREKKLSGNLLVKFTMTALTGYTLPPAGAISMPSEITVPASSASSFDFPVRFTVNKAAFDPAEHYGATFTITGVNQGVFSELDKSLEVVFNADAGYNTSRYTGRYKWTSTVQDPANQFTITNNTKPANLYEDAPNELSVFDFVAYGLTGNSVLPYNIYAFNTVTGASVALFAPNYILDNNGKVTSVVNASPPSTTITVTDVTIDPSAPNQFTYTSNDNRSMIVKYKFTLTTTINGVVTPRTVKVSESYVYDNLQAFY